MDWTPILILLICVPNALSSVEIYKAKEDEKIYLGKIYAEMDKGVKNLIRENLKSVLRVLEEKSHELNLSTKCKGNAFKLLSGLRDLKFWAVNFIDATGKPSDGILSGNIYMYGNYDQCLNAYVLKKSSGAVDFRGQYCLVSVATHLPKSELTPDKSERVALVKNLTRNLTEVIGLYATKSELFRTKHAKFGLCVPSGCNTSDVDKLIKFAGERILLNLTLHFCDTEDTLIYFTPTRIVILCIFSFVILLAIICSVIDRYSTAKNIEFKNPMMRSLICFSIPYNFEKLASTKVVEENLSFLNGIRVLTLFYIILGHHYIFKMGLITHRNFLFHSALYTPRFLFQILINGTLGVDVFFFIGGFLNCYVKAKKNLKFLSLSSSFMILIHRLIRIYPAYIFIILLNLLLNPRGPISHDIEKKYWEPCRTQWWKNIIFINNIYNKDYQCIPQSWYLAVDMQLFLISLFTIPLLFRNPKIGVLTNLAIILLSTAFTSVRVWAEKIIPTFVFATDLTQESFDDMMNVYMLPYPHASAYFGGVLLGFFVTKKRSLTLPKVKLTFGWIVASTMFLTMLFVSKRWNSGKPYTRLESALYFSLSKPLYSWSVGWLIFCCFSGHGGFINYIISWKIWIPLNRLCLSAYLLSVILQMNYFGNLRSAQDFQHEIEIWSYCGDVTITCLLAVPMVLLFESPFIALEKVIFHKKENTSKSEKNKRKEKETFKHENGTKSYENSIRI